MALTTPNMGLREWNLGPDFFSFTELANNFALIDAHDHSSGKGLQIPTGGIANQAVDTTKLADNAVTNAKVASGSLSDTKFAYPNNNIYKVIYRAVSDSGTAAGGGSYFLNQGTMVANPSGSANPLPDTFSIIGSDFFISGKATVLNLRGTVGTNATAPAVTFTFGLYPVTIAGGAGVWTVTLGTLVPSSSAAVASPGVSAFTSAASGDFAIPGDGVYALGVVLSAGAAANSRQLLHSTLRIRNT